MGSMTVGGTGDTVDVEVEMGSGEGSVGSGASGLIMGSGAEISDGSVVSQLSPNTQGEREEAVPFSAEACSFSSIFTSSSSSFFSTFSSSSSS